MNAKLIKVWCSGMRFHFLYIFLFIFFFFFSTSNLEPLCMLDIFIMWIAKSQKNNLRYLVFVRIAIFNFLLQPKQKIDWNSAVLCFKQHFRIGVWPFARFVRPLLATILCTWEIWSPRKQCISLLAKRKTYQRTDFQWSRPMTRNRRLFWGPNRNEC